ncbi:hypothetical protein LPAF129_17140 [Ligilactobacillus pabuli]|uniref:Uncharacterized protein n=1 Tax=Ligilactobacillus pabuli TaxID=2886039 RepID=A0ABQ5JJJ2_9LACO|nr:hypothetical protein LPAF129_17140 [Ligilactobacillus pabuli]
MFKRYRIFEQKHPYMSAIGETLVIIVVGLVIIYAFTGKVRTSGLIIVIGLLLGELYDIYMRRRTEQKNS